MASGLVPAIGLAGLPEHRERAIDRFVGQFVELAMFDGTVLLDIGGELLYEKSFGYAHYEFGVRHDPGTRFRIASVSKALTDAAFAVMIQAGVLTLDTSVSQYLPSFPSADKITINQLLNHTAGIPHTNDLPWGNGNTSLTLDEIMERLAGLPLDFDPGTDSNYSNGGYAVAAKILEVAGGGTFEQVMRETVFDPLGLKDTGHIVDARAPIEKIATGYEPGSYPGERRHSRFYAVETRPGGGSLYSTARDLLSFVRAAFREAVIRDDLLRSVLGADDGAFLTQGRSPGFVAKLYYDPERDAMVMVDKRNQSITGLVPLADGGFLLPVYFQRCEQARDTRVITCRMLSGNDRYTTELAPLPALLRGNP